MTLPEKRCAGREEELAAFIDGRLPDAEWAEIVEHLADCEVCREIYAETVDLLEEDEEVPEPEVPAASEEISGDRPGGVVIRPPRSRWGGTLRWTAPLAAAALLALAVASTFLRSSPHPSSASLLAAFEREDDLVARLDEGWPDPLWPVMRGPGVSVDELRRSFRLGARVVDLDLALSTPDSGADARALAADVARLLEETTPGTLVARHRAIRDRLGEGVPAASLVAEARQAEKELEEIVGVGLGLHEGYYRLGKWSEAARLAAMAGDRTFFRKRGNRRAFDRLRRELGDKAPAQLAEIAALLDGDLDTAALEELEKSLRSMIAKSGVSVTPG